MSLSKYFKEKPFVADENCYQEIVPTSCSGWKWLHYNEERDLTICFTCAKAYTKSKLHSALSVCVVGNCSWLDSGDVCFYQKVLKVT